jgi:hypothetical protein
MRVAPAYFICGSVHTSGSSGGTCHDATPNPSGDVHRLYVDLGFPTVLLHGGKCS